MSICIEQIQQKAIEKCYKNLLIENTKFNILLLTILFEMKIIIFLSLLKQINLFY